MLKQMREGAKSPIVKAVLFGLLLLAMAGLALIGGQGTIRDALKDNTVVSFGRDKLTTVVFDRMVQDAIRQQRMKQSDAYKSGLPHRILKQEIDRRLFSMAVHDNGLIIGDAEAAKQIKDMLAPYVAKGMSQRDALAGLLRANELSEADLVAAIKTDIASQQLLKTVVAGTRAPAQLAADVLRFRNEARRGEYIRLTAQNVGMIKPPSDDELRSYYSARASDYAIPEYRTLSVLVLDKNAMGDAVKISEEKIRKYYDDNIGDYQTTETRVISQVVASDEASAKAIYDAAQKDKNLQAAAKTQKGSSYIGPQSFTQDKIAVELAKAAFAGKAGDITAPVQSPLGWHVIHIEKVTPGSAQPFSAVKDAIAKQLSQDQAAEALYTFANKVDDEIAGGKTVTEVAKENHLTETTLEKIDAHGMDMAGKKAGAGLPLIDKLVESGFSLAKGAASQLIETPDGAFAIVGVKEIYPSEQKSFEKVRTDILARWTSERRLQALSEKASQAIDQLKSGGAFSKVAAEFGLSVQSTGFISRGTDPAKAGIDSAVAAALFTLDGVGLASSVPGDNTITLIRLSERKTQPSADAAKDLADMQSVLDRMLEQDILSQYRMGLVGKYNVVVNTKLLSTMYAPKADDAAGEEQ